MTDVVPVKRALISLSDKSGLEELNKTYTKELRDKAQIIKR